MIQNMDAAEDAHIVMEYYDQSGNVAATDSATLAPRAAKGFNAGRVTGLPDGFAGSLVISSDKPVAAVANDTDTDSIGMYNGFDAGSTAFYCPALYKGAGGWSSQVTVQNLWSGGNVNVTFEFYDRAGNLTATTTRSIEPYSQETVSPDDVAAIPSGWAGAVALSAANEIAAVGRINKAGISEMYNCFPSGGQIAYAPALYKNAGGWSSGVMVQNLSATTASNVQVRFYARDGTPTTTYTFDPITPKGAKAISTTRVDGLPNGWAGSAIIDGGGNNIVAVVDVTNVGAGLGNMYNAAFEGATGAFAPALYKYAGGWTAGLMAMNLSDTTSATVTFYYYNREPAVLVTQETAVVGPRGVMALNTKNVSGLPSGWAGSAYIESTLPVVVVANVTGAGKSAMYNAISAP